MQVNAFFSIRTSRLLFSSIALAVSMVLTGCANLNANQEGLRPFVSDGCSLFPDRALIGWADWCHCCLAHDKLYWKGGSEEQRLQADQALKVCVTQATNNPALADLMYAGVRLGGGPYYFTSYRWGYGWPMGRNYEPLTEAELNLVNERMAQYEASGAPSICKP